MRVVVLLILASLALGAGCKKRPTPEQCLEMCWKFNELSFWDTFEKETADLTDGQRDKARAEQQEAWDAMKDRAFDPGLKNCITSCKRGGDVDQVLCMDEAKTAADARACFD